MAVMDFREGGYVFARHRVRREFAYDQDGSGAGGSDPDNSRFAADPDGAGGLTVRLARLMHYLGALASVALVVGLMVWGWQLVSRDVTTLPVITALQGEARTTPEDPGGELTSYTGLEVNKVAESAGPTPIDQVAIAPNTPALTDEDVAMGQLGATAREPLQQADVPLNFEGEPVVPLSDSEIRTLAEARAQAAAMQAAADAAVESAAIVDAPATEGPVNEVITDENGAPAQAAAIAAALAEAQAIETPRILAQSARPAPRPRTARVVAAAQPAAVPDARPAEAAASPPPPAAAIASGGPLVQIGAFDSSSVAESEWNRLSGKFGSLFTGKGQVIQKHNANGRTFWRLRVAGFDSRSDAQSFCAAMKAGGTDCIALAAQ